MQEVKEFIKSLNILYVEDEVQAREISTKIFNRFFNNVDACENGLEGYLKFQQKHIQNEKYDLIISDINMPKMDGIEMIEKIREIDQDVPVIFVTARNESNVLLKAIQLNVVNYLIKPMEIDEINKVILKTCEKLYLKSSIENKQKELEIYLKTIEQITFITKMDIQGNITYINDNFCELLGFEKEKFLNQHFSILKHPIVAHEVYDAIWETISSGQEWEGTLRNLNSNDETIYLKTVFMPIFDNTHKNILEYFAIRYQVTDEENERKEINKKMLQNIVHFKKQAYSISQEKEKSDEEINQLKKLVVYLQEQIKQLNDSKAHLLRQLESYETSSLNQSSGKYDLARRKNEELEQYAKTIHVLRTDKENQSEKIKELNDSLTKKTNLIQLYKKDEIALKGKIKDLNDVIRDLENKLKESQKKGFFK